VWLRLRHGLCASSTCCLVDCTAFGFGCLGFFFILVFLLATFSSEVIVSHGVLGRCIASVVPVPEGQLHFHFLRMSTLTGQGRLGVRSSALGMLMTKIFQRIFMCVRRLLLKQKGRRGMGSVG